MTEFKDLVKLRRSHRKFTEEEFSPEAVQLIMRAALMSPTSKSQRAWQFVVVDDKTDIEKLADAKNLGSQFMKGAPLAVVVLGDPMRNDCWVEDGSIAAISMQYQAEELGLGSCWVQMRGLGLDHARIALHVQCRRGDTWHSRHSRHLQCALCGGFRTQGRRAQAAERGQPQVGERAHREILGEIRHFATELQILFPNFAPEI